VGTLERSDSAIEPMETAWQGPGERGRQRLATAWLGLGVTALALAGIFAILLVAARSPGTGSLFPTQDFFRVALIVHVDESVLIWFLAFGAVLWSLAARPVTGLPWLGVGVAAVGCLLVAASPFLGAAAPLLNNYVPVLEHPLFVWALGLFALGVAIQILAYLLGVRGTVAWSDPLALGTLTAAAAALIAALSLVWTWARLNPAWEGQAYYDYLMWGPGHALQFAYTQILLVAWIWLARALGLKLPIPSRALSALLVLGVLPLFAVPAIHGLYAPDSPETRLAFTRIMQWGNGLAAVPIGAAVMIALVRGLGQALGPADLAIQRALAASLILFAAGGVLSLLIAGSNTIVPAHYHGAIVGVTLALMGLTYYLLPRLGFGRPEGRMARLQPWIYGVGQLLHIGGLAVSGGHGVARKTAGAAQGLDALGAKASMAVMGIGGLLAVIGGILFVLAVIGAFARRPG
jgi:cytochrome c oxidase subunit 1